MFTLREKLSQPDSFHCGVELVTTRGTMSEGKAVRTRGLAGDLVQCDQVDWVSITDNAGGNPMLGPMALGKPILYGGKNVVIHLSCKDFNRNGLESEAWQLASEGFHNILALSGDYPGEGYQGQAKPVFDVDSVGLLTLLSDMNRGLALPARRAGSRQLGPTEFFLGAVTTNFKLHENEVMPQYFKLEEKLEAGAQFIIAQIGYDARKSHELKAYLEHRGHPPVPLIGNVYLLSVEAARFFNSGKIPGVVVSDALRDECVRQGGSKDRGRSFFIELAAKQVAYFRGLGYRGVYLGGVESVEEIRMIMDCAAAFGSGDWKQFAREIRYSRPGEFFYLEEDPETGLADLRRVNPVLADRRPTKNVTAGYRLSRWFHDVAFTPGRKLFDLGRKRYANAKDPRQGPGWLRTLEHASKTLMFGCKDCGDCSLPEIAFLCPESQCAKNQRNGPCGGTRDGKCEVAEFDCIWARAYDRLKSEGRAGELLRHAPVIQNQALRGTSAWGNAFLGRDHQARKRSCHSPSTEEKPVCLKRDPSA